MNNRAGVLLGLITVAALGCSKGERTADQTAVAANSPAPAPAPAASPTGFVVDTAGGTHTASGLVYKDVVAGTGPAVRVGQTVSVHYVGTLTNGTAFDSNGPNDPPYTFPLGGHRVIAGWDEGVVGMKVGGQRVLVIPPALGYGAGGSGPIPPNATLVFVIKMVSAN